MKKDCGSSPLLLQGESKQKEKKKKRSKEQKADCGIWRQRWDLEGLICCSNMIRLERGGRKSWLGRSHIHLHKHTHTHIHKDDGSDWKGFPLGFLSSSFSFFLYPHFLLLSQRQRYLPAHQHSISTSIWTTAHTYTHTHTLSKTVCVRERTLASYKRSAVLTQSTTSQ